MADVTVEEFVAAGPERVYDLVSDVTNMGRWSPETTGCRWLDGVSSAVEGARFRGANRSGWRRWSTTCTVVAADRGRRFAFDVRYGPWTLARWTYDFEAEGDGCRVRETWSERRPQWLRRIDPFVMGVPDRGEHNRTTMQATLGQLRDHLSGAARGR